MASRGAKLFTALAGTALLLLMPMDFLEHAVHELRMTWRHGSSLSGAEEYGVERASTYLHAFCEISAAAAPISLEDSVHSTSVGLNLCLHAGGIPQAASHAPSFNFEAHSQLWAWFKEDRAKTSHTAPPLKENITEEDIAAAGFNWRGYLLRNPDLRQQGIRTPAAAYRHYVEIGQSLGRRHDR